MRRAIFYYGSLHGAEEEFLLALRVRHVQFDIQNVSQGIHENLQAVL
jgi:hypothetical protein